MGVIQFKCLSKYERKSGIVNMTVNVSMRVMKLY